MTVDLKKIILTAVAFSTAAVSCTEKVQVEPVPAGRGIEFALAYEDYHDGEGRATDGSSGNGFGNGYHGSCKKCREVCGFYVHVADVWNNLQKFRQVFSAGTFLYAKTNGFTSLGSVCI